MRHSYFVVLIAAVAALENPNVLEPPSEEIFSPETDATTDELEADAQGESFCEGCETDSLSDEEIAILQLTEDIESEGTALSDSLDETTASVTDTASDVAPESAPFPSQEDIPIDELENNTWPAAEEPRGFVETQGLGNLFTNNFRGGLGNIISGGLAVALPGTCIGAALNAGYTHPGEDDYPFMPACAGKGVSNYIACLPGDAMVVTASGPLPMSELKEGDMIATDTRSDGSIQFHPIQYFLHQLPEGVGNYIELGYDGGKLVAAQDHLAVRCKQTCEMKAVREIAPGDELVKSDGSRVPVKTYSMVPSAQLGLFAPVTSSDTGKLLVDGVWVSEFSRVPMFASGLDGMTHSVGRWATRTASRALLPRRKTTLISLVEWLSYVGQRLVSVNDKIAYGLY